MYKLYMSIFIFAHFNLWVLFLYLFANIKIKEKELKDGNS